MNVLHDGLLALGFEKSEFFGFETLPLPKLEENLEKYIALLQEFNAKFDLINADNHDEIVVRHILDSLSALPKICEILAATQKEKSLNNLELADIGSGAGLPGIPLATALPTLKFTLVERMTKRCGFLNICAQEIGLKNVTVEENQAERLEQKRFDLCVFRAFRPLDKKMAKVLLRILKDDGKLAAYKAKKENIIEEMENLVQKPIYEIFPLKVPFLTENTIKFAENEEKIEARERNLVIIQKN